MKKILRFLFLPYQKKKLLFQSIFLVCVIRICLWIFPFKWLNKLVSYFDSKATDSEQLDWLVVNDVARSIRASCRHIPYASCLTQALAARTLLKLKGQNTQLRIGVDKDGDDKLSAHAWIEADGRIIIGKYPHHQRYLVLVPSDSAIL
jgi:hypothetical protein